MPLPSLIQCTLFSSPHSGCTAWLTWVTCFHSPIGPAHTSGGCAAEWRITAEVLWSAASEIPIPPQASVVTTSGPVHRGVILPVATSTVAAPASPSMFSAKRILSGDCQVIQLGDALISGVRLRASPPLAGTKKTSPPVDPSSLISPAMNAILLPSGDQRGTAICKGGL